MGVQKTIIEAGKEEIRNSGDSSRLKAVGRSSEREEHDVEMKEEKEVSKKGFFPSRERG